MGPEALDAVAAVTTLLRTSKDKTVRANAAYALGGIGLEPDNAREDRRQAIRDALRPAVPVLKEALKDDSSSVRLFAANALAVVGREKGVPTLVVGALKQCLLDKKDPGIRASAAESLGEMQNVRGTDPEVVPILVRLWKTDRDEVRRAAFDALKKIAPAEVQPGR
jgi:HEAT repeat protein